MARASTASEGCGVGPDPLHCGTRSTCRLLTPCPGGAGPGGDRYLAEPDRADEAKATIHPCRSSPTKRVHPGRRDRRPAAGRRPHARTGRGSGPPQSPMPRSQLLGGVQLGDQTERNWRNLGPNASLPTAPNRGQRTGSVGLGAGRSQVQILSPRLKFGSAPQRASMRRIGPGFVGFKTFWEADVLGLQRTA